MQWLLCSSIVRLMWPSALLPMLSYSLRCNCCSLTLAAQQKASLPAQQADTVASSAAQDSETSTEASWPLNVRRPGRTAGEQQSGPVGAVHFRIGEERIRKALAAITAPAFKLHSCPLACLAPAATHSPASALPLSVRIAIVFWRAARPLVHRLE